MRKPNISTAEVAACRTEQALDHNGIIRDGVIARGRMQMRDSANRFTDGRSSGTPTAPAWLSLTPLRSAGLKATSQASVSHDSPSTLRTGPTPTRSIMTT